MSERTKLLKKAVLTSVGASGSPDRIKQAINQVMDDLVKVGQELIEDLENEGKVKTESVQNFLKNLQKEASKRTSEIEKQVSKQVQSGMKKAIKDIGLITREDYEELLDRLCVIEDALVPAGSEPRKARRHKRS